MFKHKYKEGTVLVPLLNPTVTVTILGHDKEEWWYRTVTQGEGYRGPGTHSVGYNHPSDIEDERRYCPEAKYKTMLLFQGEDNDV